MLRFWVPTVLLALITTIAQQFYVARSEALTPGVLTELPFVSSTHLISFFERRRGTWADTVFSDSINRSAARIQGYYINPSRIIYLTADYYDDPTDPRAFCARHPCLFVASPAMFAEQAKLRAMRVAYWNTDSFDFSLSGEASAVDHFRYDLRGTDAHLTRNTQIIEQIRESVLNHWADLPRPGDSMYRVTAPSAVKDHLVFVPGSAGTVVGAPSSLTQIGLYPLEPDPFYRDEPMSALGRYLLFRTIAPSDHVRLVLWISASFNGVRNDQLPPAVAVGERREPFHLVGRGSARVFSDVLVPRSMDDMRFVGLDLGRNAAPVSQAPRSWLMRLYGRDVSLDPRLSTVRARDISLIDARRYAQMQPPASIEHFPADLANPTLQYSGVYEDGWISDRAYFVLQPPASETTLVVHALVPLLGDASYRTRICVRLDAVPPVCKVQGPGAFSYAQAVSSATRHTVEIDVLNPQRARTADHRLLGARLDFVGFER